jgi:hypothetical protein
MFATESQPRSYERSHENGDWAWLAVREPTKLQAGLHSANSLLIHCV